MSNFHRAYAAAVEAAELSQAEIAARSGLAQATVSRAMQGDVVPELESLGRLLKALENETDRLHCQRAYLLDHTLEEFRERLKVSLGEPNEDRPRPKDAISRALEILDRAAGDNLPLRRLLTALAELMEEQASGRVEEAGVSYGSSVDDLLDRADRRAPDGAPTRDARPRVVPVSSKTKRGSKR